MKTHLSSGKMRNSQRGFTLIELLVVVAITGILGTVLASAVSQIILINAFTTNHLEAIKQVENALHYVNRDAQAAQNVSVYEKGLNGQYSLKTGDPVSYVLAAGDNSTIRDNLTLTWTDWQNNTNKIEYWITDQVLFQKLTVNAGTVNQSVTQKAVAQHITGASGDWEKTIKTLTLNITSGLPGFESSSETRTLKVIPRSAQ
jgi:prepilin-type N-terminal cleavage/methylation domain-containing protein